MINDVKLFMEAGDQFSSNKEDLIKLYQKLIVEEYDEFISENNAANKEGEFDACLDLIWVLVGYMLANGWNVDGGWKEVSRSNMSKINPETGKMDKRSDGKVIKHPLWSPPNLKPFMDLSE